MSVFFFLCGSSFRLSELLCCVISAQALQDPGVYGVIQSGDHRGRTCVVKWIKLNSTSDDVEVSQKNDVIEIKVLH